MFPRVRLLVAVAVAAVAVGVASVVPLTPADAGDTNTRVLVFGDSVAHSFGCALGDEGPPPAIPCPDVAGFRTRNAFEGACSIARGKVLGYDGGIYKSPCNPKKQWQPLIDSFDPDVVILNTGGWEIVDRWVKSLFSPPPTGPPRFRVPGPTHMYAVAGHEAGVLQYRNKLRAALNLLTANDVTVIVSNLPYVNPPSPNSGVYYETYPDTKPAGWKRPNKPGAGYRSSRLKADEFNAMVASVVDEYDPEQVLAFPFAEYFNPGGVFGKWVCVPDSEDGLPPLPALPCSEGAPDAVLARNNDGLHLSTAGITDILQPALIDFIQAIPGLPTSTTTTTTTTTTLAP
jgi:hypothetical protein